MKAKNLLTSAVLLTTMMGGAVTSFAAEYEDATHAKTDATITFTKDDGPTGPVDPGNPGIEIDPIDPSKPNPNGAELMISYASDLNFGEQSKNGTSWNALADKVKAGEEIREITPFVSTKDSRGEERKGWTLTAKQDADFKDGTNVLKGAELHLSNLFYAEQAGAPTATAGEVILGSDAQDISSAKADSGIGRWSVGLGELEGEEGSQTTTGVTLTVPETTAKNAATYSTTVTWELVADPAAAE